MLLSFTILYIWSLSIYHLRVERVASSERGYKASMKIGNKHPVVSWIYSCLQYESVLTVLRMTLQRWSLGSRWRWWRYVWGGRWHYHKVEGSAGVNMLSCCEIFFCILKIVLLSQAEASYLYTWFITLSSVGSRALLENMEQRQKLVKLTQKPSVYYNIWDMRQPSWSNLWLTLCRQSANLNRSQLRCRIIFELVKVLSIAEGN